MKYRPRLAQLIILQSVLSITAMLLIALASAYAALQAWQEDAAAATNTVLAEAIAEEIEGLADLMHESLAREARNLQGLTGASRAAASAAPLLARLHEWMRLSPLFEDGIRIRVSAADGSILYRFDSGMPPETGRDVVQSGHDTVAGLGWRITVQRPLAPLQAQRLQWVQQVLLIVALPFGFVLFLSVMFLREISVPLRELASLIDVTDPLDGRPTSRARHAVLLRRLHSLSGWYQEAWLIKQALLRRIDMVHGSIQTLRTAANTDALTQLGNRRALAEALDSLAATAEPFGVIALDIDHFKRINDCHGHAQGDRAIRRVADELRRHARSMDLVLRTGGDEFLILLPGIDPAVLADVAQRIARSIADADILPDDRITVSAGVALWAAGTPAGVLEAADQALYRAKAGGRNRVAGAEVADAGDTDPGAPV
ncbi:diguanylate cyclase domain-containing protein [Castellaniella sp.]|uniref:GGDEF domain-containing protein n=1 Tax=Castellaniella sp. TaxID=1955812 RepID=UPI00355F5E15